MGCMIHRGVERMPSDMMSALQGKLWRSVLCVLHSTQRELTRALVAGGSYV